MKYNEYLNVQVLIVDKTKMATSKNKKNNQELNGKSYYTGGKRNYLGVE